MTIDVECLNAMFLIFLLFCLISVRCRALGRSLAYLFFYIFSNFDTIAQREAIFLIATAADSYHTRSLINTIRNKNGFWTVSGTNIRTAETASIFPSKFSVNCIKSCKSYFTRLFSLLGFVVEWKSLFSIGPWTSCIGIVRFEYRRLCIFCWKVIILISNWCEWIRVKVKMFLKKQKQNFFLQVPQCFRNLNC